MFGQLIIDLYFFMKKSIYNNELCLSSPYYLIYNTFTNSFLVIKRNLYDAYLSLSIPDIFDKYPTFYNQLLQAGCFVADEENELEKLKHRITEIDECLENYTLIINPTINCNFSCWYCYEKHLAQSKMSSETLEFVKRHITKIASNNVLKCFSLGFFGGEPLLYYKDVVRPLLKHFQATCLKFGINPSVAFTSNGYLLTDSMIKELKTFGISSFQITLDGNKSLHNTIRFPFVGADSYTKIVNNIKKLLVANIFVVLRINYTSDNLINTKDIAKDFENLPCESRKRIHVDFQRVWQDKKVNDTDISDTLIECIEAFEKIGIKVYGEILNQVWNSCYADKKHQAVINFNGDVFKCTARDFTKENRLGTLNEDGTITWDEKKMKQREGVRLSKEVCQHCRIAPICGGTCTQRGLDSGDSNQCVRGLDESGKDKIVLNQFYYNVVKNEVPV